MQTIMTVIGSIGLLLIGVGAACYAAGYLLEKWAEHRWATGRLRQRDTLRDLGASLKHQAYWFSEDERAMEALVALAESLLETGNLDIREARDRWYRKNAVPVDDPDPHFAK